ncbi:tetratricopeptide repeat protein, partial [Streptococcus pneumoniae]
DLQSEEPENLLTKWMIARSYQEMDDLDTAYEHYQELTGDLKDNPEFLEHYIYLLRELGHFEEAKVHAHTYLKLVPDDVQMQELFERL